MADKPTCLTKDPDAEAVVALFRALTSRELTPEEIEQMRAELAADDEPKE